MKEQCDYQGVEFGNDPSETCLTYLDTVDSAIAKINIYNIYGECYGGAPDFDTEITYVDNEGFLTEGRRLKEK